MISVCPEREAVRIERAGLGKASVSGERVALVMVEPHLRLDNRDELLAALQMPRHSSDAQILVEGWRRWNQRLASRLRGTFAFAIHDADRASIYVARDIFGLSPVYFHSDSRTVCLATSSRRLRALLPTPPATNDVLLADFLSHQMVERDDTFFIGIKRLRPAHWMLISPFTVQSECYWSPADVPRDMEPDDPARRFREALERSVARCQASPKTGILLSGGLDSSSIAALADSRGMPAFAMTYPKTQGWSDGPYLAEIANLSGVRLREFPSDTHNPLEDMPFWLEAVDGPYLSAGHSVSNRLLLSARRAGCDTVLSGHGGDEIVSYGYGRLNEIARMRQWWTLWNELPDYYAHSRVKRLKHFQHYLAHSGTVRRLRARFGRQSGPGASAPNSLSDSFAASIPADRYTTPAARNRLDHDERMLHEEILQSPLQPLSLEITALSSRAAGIATRLPFYDRDLVELSLSLPSHWKLQGRMPRYILREALRGHLPEKIRVRPDKFNFAGNFIAGLVASRDEVLDLTKPDGQSWSSMINIDYLQDVRDELSRDGTRIDMIKAVFLWEVAILTLWQQIMRKGVPHATLHQM